jgi:hypothetical protein
LRPISASAPATSFRLPSSSRRSSDSERCFRPTYARSATTYARSCDSAPCFRPTYARSVTTYARSCDSAPCFRPTYARSVTTYARSRDSAPCFRPTYARSVTTYARSRDSARCFRPTYARSVTTSRRSARILARTPETDSRLRPTELPGIADAHESRDRAIRPLAHPARPPGNGVRERACDEGHGDCHYREQWQQ